MALLTAYSLLDTVSGAVCGYLGAMAGKAIAESYGFNEFYKAVTIAATATAGTVTGLYAAKPFIDKANEPMIAKQGEEVLAMAASVATAAAMYKTLQLTADKGPATQYAATVFVGPVAYATALITGRYIQEFISYIASIFGKKEEKDKKKKEEEKKKDDKKDKKKELTLYEQLLQAFGIKAK